MVVDPSTTKYLIKASIKADGVIEKPDVVGAVFGQTEGLLGNELDLRDLQKSARIGRIEVEIDAKKGKSEGTILLPSSLDKVETAILGAALESIDRVGPCKAKITVVSVEDVRVVRRKQVIDRAKQILSQLVDDSKSESEDLVDEVKTAVQVAEITRFGAERLPAGPNVNKADAIIIVEGRNDVLNLLKHGIKNAVAVEGTNIPKSVQDKSRECVTTAFVDGDRGGELIVRELLQTCEIDFVARAPQTREVEEIPQKLIMKALKNKIPAEQFAEMYGIPYKKTESGTKSKAFVEKAAKAAEEDLDRLAGPGGPEGDDEPPARTPQPSAPCGGGRPPERADDSQKKSEKGGFFKRLRGDRDEAEAPRGGGEPPKTFSSDQQRFKDALEGLKGSLKAVLLDGQGNEVQKGVAVRDLAETLKGVKDGVESVVFDGVITQRLLDIALDKKIKTVVGAKVGNVTKKPEGVTVYSRDDLQ
jgi:DNA primase